MRAPTSYRVEHLLHAMQAIQYNAYPSSWNASHHDNAEQHPMHYIAHEVMACSVMHIAMNVLQYCRVRGSCSEFQGFGFYTDVGCRGRGSGFGAQGSLIFY